MIAGILICVAVFIGIGIAWFFIFRDAKRNPNKEIAPKISRYM
jgi:hypothetical protein